MAPPRKTGNEAPWVAVAYRNLPGHLTWPGFCIVMFGHRSTPQKTRLVEYPKLDFLIRCAETLAIEPLEFIAEVMAELAARKQSHKEVGNG